MTVFKYINTNFMRTLKIIPPLLTFILIIYLLYFYKGVDMISSYVISCMIVYLFSVWVSFLVFQSDKGDERQYLVSVIQSKKKYLIYKTLYAFFIMTLISLFALVYPIVMGTFKENIGYVFFIFLICHLLTSVFGILISSIFSYSDISNKKYLFPLILLITILSLSVGFLPSVFKYFAIFLPPMYKVIDIEKHIYDVNYIVIIFLYSIFYSIVIFLLNAFIFQRSETY